MLSGLLAVSMLMAGDDATKALGDLVKKLESADNYTFEVLNESDGAGFGGFGGRGGRGGGGDEGGAEAPERPAPTPTMGHFMKGHPVHLKSGETEGYRDGEQLVVKNEEGKWAPLARGGRGGFGGRGGGEGGGRGDSGGGGGGGGDARPPRGDRGSFGRGSMSAFALTGVQLPHEVLAGLAEKVKTAEMTEADDKVVFKGELTKEGAQSLAGGSRFGGGRGGFGGGGGGGGGGPEFDYSGTYEIVVNKKDHTMKFHFATNMSGSFGDRDFERASKATYTLSKLGETKVEIPAEVLSQFEI